MIGAKEGGEVGLNNGCRQYAAKQFVALTICARIRKAVTRTAGMPNNS